MRQGAQSGPGRRLLGLVTITAMLAGAGPLGLAIAPAAGAAPHQATAVKPGPWNRVASASTVVSGGSSSPPTKAAASSTGPPSRAGKVHATQVQSAGDFVAPLGVSLGLAAGGAVDGIATGDFNGDGRLDVAVTEHHVDGTEHVMVLLGNGDRSFGAPVELSVPEAVNPLPAALIAKDLGNGKLDLVVTSPSLDAVVVYLGHGDGTFAAPTQTTLSGPPTEIQAADLTGGGHLDLVAILPVTDQVVTLIGDGAGGFVVGTTSTVPATPTDLAVGPLRPGGKADIAVSTTGGGPSKGFEVLLNNGSGAFPAAATAVDDGLSATSGLEIGGFTTSPNPGVLVSGDGCFSFSGSCQVLLHGKGDGTFSAPTAADVESMGTGGTRGPVDNAAPDLNGDAHSDAVWVHHNSGSSTTVTTALGDGNGGFSLSDWVGAVQPDVTLSSVIAADLAGTGTPDLVVGGSVGKTGGGLWVVASKPGAPGRFQTGTMINPIPATHLNSYPGSTVAGSFTASGHQDLVTLLDKGGIGQPDVIEVYPGNGDGTFGAVKTTTVGLGTPGAGLVAGDFNGDGKTDIAWTTANGIGFAFGNGDGSFQPAVVISGSGGSGDLHLVDINGDGHPDLVNIVGDAFTEDLILAAYLWDPVHDTFLPPAIPALHFPGHSEGSLAFGVGQFSANGHLDVATISNQSVVIFKGNGDGTFNPPNTVGSYCAQFAGGAIASGVLTASGHPDLVWQCGGDLEVALGAGDGTFAAPVAYAEPLPNSNARLILADVTGSGHLDAVAAGAGAQNGPDGVTVWPGHGDGTFGSALSYAVGNTTSDPGLIAAPLSGPGGEDVVVSIPGPDVAHVGSLVTVLQATGTTVLQASAVSAPTPSSPGPEDPTTVTYKVTNIGGRTAVGGWLDSVFVDTGTTYTPGDLRLGTVAHGTNLAPGQSYTATLTAPFPPSTAGPRHLVVVPDGGGLVNGLQPEGQSASPAFNVAPVPTLTIGGPPLTVSIAAGQVRYFQVNPTVGLGLVVNATFAVSNESTFAEQHGVLPDPVAGTADQTYPTSFDKAQTLAVANPQGGIYFIMLVGQAAAGTGQNFTLTANQPTLAVTGFSPPGFGGGSAVVGGSGVSRTCSISGSAICDSVTLTVHGTGFTPRTAINLVPAGGGPAVAATAVTYVDAGTLTAAFPDPPGALGLAFGQVFGAPPTLAAGLYTVQALDPAGNATSANTLNVQSVPPPPGCVKGVNGHPGSCPPPPPPPVQFSVSTASAFRPPQVPTVTVNWANNGATDQPAPILELAGTNALFNDPTTGLSTGQPEIQLLGVGSSPQAGVLAPGEHGSLTLTFSTPTNGPHVFSTFQLFSVNPSFAVDWTQAGGSLKPADVTPAAWSVDLANFTADAGPNLGSYEQLLGRAASYLSSIGAQPNGDASQEVAIEMATADDFGAISSRFTTGALGLGRPDPTDLGLSVDPGGNVTLHHAGSEEVFVDQPDGSLRPPPGDSSVLAKQVDGTYHLSSPDGSVSVWKANGQLDSSADSDGNRTTAAYDGQGRLISLTTPGNLATTYGYDSSNRIVTITPPSGRIATIAYDAAGRMHQQGVGAASVTYTYAPATDPAADQNAVTSTTDATGAATTSTYDSRGRTTSSSGGGSSVTFSYGPFGQSTVTDASGAATTTYADTRGRSLRTVDPLGRVTSTTLDSLGRRLSITAPGGLTTTYGHDQQGNVASVTDPLGHSSNFTYDSLGDLASATTPNGNTTHYNHDGHGHVTGVTYPDGTTSTATYTATGQLSTSTDQSGHTVTDSYDASLRLIKQAYDDGTAVSYTYDGQQDLQSVTDPSGVVTYSYSSTGALAGASYPGGHTLTYTYDNANRLTKSTDQANFSLMDTYNSVGQLSTVADSTGATVATETYDRSGRLSVETRGNATSVAYGHDPVGQLTSVTNKSPAGAITSQYTLAYNGAGQPTTIGTPGGVETLGFDGTGQVTSVTLPGGRTIAYSYDGDGNRTTVTDNGTVTDYTVNNLDQYTNVGATTYSYDRDGRALSAAGPGGSSAWTYNQRGWLTGATTPSGAASYAYDPVGDRTASTSGGAQTGYLPDPAAGGIPFAEYTGTGSLVDHLLTLGTSLIGAEPSAGGASYDGTDNSQNVTQVTDPTGAVTGTASYLPFGQVLATTGATGNHGFTGAAGTTTEPTGEQFIHFRAYDPALGRFLSPDLLGGPTANTYAYAANNPVELLDRNGFEPDLVATGVSAVSYGIGSFGSSFTAIGTGLDNLFGAVTAGAKGSALANRVVDFGVVAFNQAGGNAASFDPFNGPQLFYRYGTDELRLLDRAASQAQGLGLDLRLGAAGLSIAVDLAALFLNPYSISNTAEQGGLIVADIISAGFPPAGLAAHAIAAVAHAFADPGGPLDVINEWWYSPTGRSKQIADILHFFGPDGFLKGPIAKIEQLFSNDPNDIYGPVGFGPLGWLPVTATLPYDIEFANQPSASAPAQVVKVTETLDPNADPSTFAYGPVGFGTTTVTPPAGQSSWSVTVADSPSLSVRVTGSLDLSSGVVTWTFTSVNPDTGVPITDATAGFLPPDKTPPIGEGHVSYHVQPKASTATGTALDAQASVTFDQNAPLVTAKVVNTIDADAPGININPLPATTPAGPLHLTWAGNDGAGSGVASYDVYVSVDGAPMVNFDQATTATSTTYNIATGHTYGFAVSATDNVGNGGGIPVIAQVSTTAVTPAPPTGAGYDLAAADGGVFNFGGAPFDGSLGNLKLNAPVVGVAANPAGAGYWLVARDGGIFTFGGAPFLGSAAGFGLNQPVVGMAPTPSGRGYWLVTAAGGVFDFGDAGVYGSLAGSHLNQSITGIAATPDGHGYWLVAADGGVFSFGDAGFYGSTGNLQLNQPVVAMAAASDGNGYWLVAADGGVFSFGSAPFQGALGNLKLNAPVVGMAADRSGPGYWLVAADGGVFTFGNAPFEGSLGNLKLNAPVVGIEAIVGPR